MERECGKTDGLLAGARAVIARGYDCGDTSGRGGVRCDEVGGFDANCERQEIDVEAWAKEIGVWWNDPLAELERLYGERIANGSEAYVYAMDGQYVIKARDIYGYKSLDEALESIELHNVLFPATAMRVLGFGRSDGDFNIVFVQRYVKAARFADAERIARMMKEEFDAEKDEMVLGGNSYENDVLLLQDLKPANVLEARDGMLYVIDGDFYRK